MAIPYLHPLQATKTEAAQLPESLNDPFSNTIPQIAAVAVKELQNYLITQQDFDHNFGLSNKNGKVIGKMFGVLVVKYNNKLGYLAAFSGKLANSNQHKHFVPPIYDMLTPNSFLNKGMLALTELNKEIKNTIDDKQKEVLVSQRKEQSQTLQKKLFEHYNILNQYGKMQNILEIFQQQKGHLPPAAAGECAAPKLLQFAFENQLKPIAITEFWWGKSPKSTHWKHLQHYPACEEKCRPILTYML